MTWLANDKQHLTHVAQAVCSDAVLGREPTPETIASADFPISRFLYTYVNAEMADSDPAVAAFVDYMMSDAGLESVTAVGYIDLAEADQQLAQSVWANRITGRSFSG